MAAFKDFLKRNYWVAIIIFVIAILIVIAVVFGPSLKALWKPEIPTSLIDELQILATKSHDYEQCLLKANEIIVKDPNNKDAWQWKGACEFGLKKFSDSKTSFEKLLTLDPQNAGAKNYLKILNNPQGNLTSLVSVSEQDLEAQLDFVPDESILTFVQAYKIPAKEDRPALTISEYNSLKTFDETVSYFEAQLKKAGVKFEVVKQKNGNIYNVNGKKTVVDYNISVAKGSPVGVQIIIFEKK